MIAITYPTRHTSNGEPCGYDPNDWPEAFPAIAINEPTGAMVEGWAVEWSPKPCPFSDGTGGTVTMICRHTGHLSYWRESNVSYQTLGPEK